MPGVPARRVGNASRLLDLLGRDRGDVDRLDLLLHLRLLPCELRDGDERSQLLVLMGISSGRPQRFFASHVAAWEQ